MIAKGVLMRSQGLRHGAHAPTCPLSCYATAWSAVKRYLTRRSLWSPCCLLAESSLKTAVHHWIKI